MICLDACAPVAARNSRNNPAIFLRSNPAAAMPGPRPVKRYMKFISRGFSGAMSILQLTSWEPGVRCLWVQFYFFEDGHSESRGETGAVGQSLTGEDELFI